MKGGLRRGKLPQKRCGGIWSTFSKVFPKIHPQLTLIQRSFPWLKRMACIWQCTLTIHLSQSYVAWPGSWTRRRILKGWYRSIPALITVLLSVKVASLKWHAISSYHVSPAQKGVNIPETIRVLGKSVHFVHFRDVIGTKDKFVETFQDEGQTDMLAALQAWKEVGNLLRKCLTYFQVGFTGPIRPDHVPLLPTLETGHATGEKAVGYFSGKASGNFGSVIQLIRTGYTMMGRLFAVGYMRGLMHAVFGKELGSAKTQSLNQTLQTQLASLHLNST